jgi:pimeloyl-ACP methyl ester carboxylesterase
MSDGVLLIHAFPMDARMWDAQREALGGLAVVAPHLPGFGGTDSAGEVLTMAAAARACLDALDDAGIDRAMVCGLSMGGYVAFELWRSAPARVRGLVLANTRAGADTDEGADGRRALAARLGSEGNGFLVESPPPLLGEGAPEELWSWVRSVIADQPADAIAAAALGMAERPDSTPDLATIQVPTMVVTSSGDTLIPPEMTTPMADAVPDASLSVIEGAGHLSNLERSGEFSELLASHATRCGLT